VQRPAADEPNPIRAEADWPAAVIAGAYQTGVLAVRGLSRRGVRVSCFDSNPKFEGFRSVYGKAHLCPNPDSDPRGWVAFMIALSERVGGKPALICSSDQFVSAVARHAEELSRHFLLSAGIRLHGLLATKQTQYELAVRHGMPLPRTQFVHSAAEVTAFAEEAQFPCLVKPIHFREWQAFPPEHPLFHEKVAIAASPADLARNWQLASTVNGSVILQEIIQGPDANKRVYLSCYDRGSRRIANAMFRELRCSPLQFGPATVTEPVVDAETDDVCDRFLRSMGYSGICEIEMKRDTRDGRVKLIEANPRLSGGGDAAPYAGVDLCWLHYLDMIGQTVTPVAPSGRDFRHVVLRSDVGAIIDYRRARLISWGDVRRSYKPPLAFFDFDLHDWRYSARTIYRMVRSALGALVRMMR
jgi:predicted ATP-grasp superfamily ATP-dependent carboligase